MPDRSMTSSGSSAASRQRLALRFISGKYQGGEFPIDDAKEIVIGRSSDLDMVLVEEMVSRRHARIAIDADGVTIEDMGSTNGTFVNGEKVRSATLREGDRVLIGTSILKLVALAPEPESSVSADVAAKRRVTMRQSVPPDEAPRMSGNLEEIPLPDLMQLFGTSKKSGVLVLRTNARLGRIYLSEGRTVFAAIEGQPEVMTLKACYRMLTWKKGFFALDPPSTQEFSEQISVSAQEMLMEGFRQQDELEAIRERLPSDSARLVLKTPLEAPLQKLEPTHLKVLQTALNSESYAVLLDRSPESDLATGRIVLELIKSGYLQVE